MFIHLKWVCWIEFAWLCYNKMFICYVSLWRPDLWRVSRCFLYFEWKWVKVWSVRNFQLEWTWHIVTIKGYRIIFFFHPCCSATLSLTFFPQQLHCLECLYQRERCGYNLQQLFSFALCRQKMFATLFVTSWQHKADFRFSFFFFLTRN